ncbi:sulfurtransferase complex subunit TusB [Caldisericum exile]|uniref:DsrH family protein n=1 Tax=Caldisericum exile (strain DSM 21853 / NBRC 104410 / AZM16c01) TaxID=511051 RepID=A0A7U6JEJ4_CALEA|nr:sulfurtransferase complex subunit TusB [Caldisericum exile]BAL80523.1 DsrH family protein [Caldisericum exile AZM16c01]
MALIIIKKSPDYQVAHLLLEIALPQDKVIFLQDGVLFAVEKDVKTLVKDGVELFALKEDFVARGFDEKESLVPLISYDEFAEIVEKEPKIIS